MQRLVVVRPKRCRPTIEINVIVTPQTRTLIATRDEGGCPTINSNMMALLKHDLRKNPHKRNGVIVDINSRAHALLDTSYVHGRIRSLNAGRLPTRNALVPHSPVHDCRLSDIAVTYDHRTRHEALPTRCWSYSSPTGMFRGRRQSEASRPVSLPVRDVPPVAIRFGDSV